MREARWNQRGDQMKTYGFGVDVGGTTVKIGLFETEGRLLERWEIPTDCKQGGVNILPDIAGAIDKKLEQAGIDKSSVQGIGIGVPGPVMSNGTVNGCVNLGWGTVNVQGQLERLTGLPVRAGNDANVAALGEMWQGGAKGCRDVIMVTLGTGVGGGIISDGRIVTGYGGAGGEIGHITVERKETEPCNCGRCGCLEQYVSATGIVRLAKRRLAGSGEPTGLRGIPELSAKDIFDEAKKGDRVAAELVDELGAILGVALSNMACVVNPEVIVIGGGVSAAGSMLIETVERHFAGVCFGACRGTRFSLAQLGNDAGMYGCMHMLLLET